MDNKNRGGVGFLGLLTLLFIGLKLTGYIAWSWIWVLAPLWIPLSIALLIIFVLILFVGLGKLNINKTLKDKKEKYV